MPAPRAPAFTRLVERHSSRLIALARRLARDGDEADDLVQETWLRVYLAWGRYRPGGSLWSWIATICTNAHIDAQRAAGRRRVREAAAALVFHEPRVGIEEILVTRARREAVKAAIGQLPARQREIMERRAYREQPTPVIARELQCAPSTVRAATTHACHRLRPMLEGWRD